ncbi:DHA2 family efflux MFS transporter permease subunit [Pediococcus damnosus]|nr:DHA2 family efflux MFS transporter permease subunit [Pediococcus damnosus]
MKPMWVINFYCLYFYILENAEIELPKTQSTPTLRKSTLSLATIAGVSSEIGGFFMQSSQSHVPFTTKLAIFGLAGLAFCGVLIETSMNVTFPTLMKQFDVSLNTVQWITTAYLLVVAAVISVAAFMERRYLFKQLFFVAAAMILIGIFICGSATSFPMLLVGRIVQAISTGITMPLLIAEIMQEIPLAKQGSYMGIGGMVIALAPSLGPTYGGLVTQNLSWRFIFWLILPIAIIASVVGLLFIKQGSAPQKSKFPWSQFVSFVLALIMLTLGVNNAGNYGWNAIQFYGYVIIGILFLGLFVYLAQRSQTPLINLSIFKHWAFTLPLIIYFSIQFVQLSLTFLLPNYAQLVLHQGTFISGFMLFAGSLASSILAPITGRILDEYGIGKPLLIGSGFILMATLGFVVFHNNLNVGLIAILYALYAIGFSFMFNNSLTSALQNIPPQLIGDGNATFNTLQQYAGSMGTAIASAMLIGHGTQHISVIQQTANGATSEFILVFIVCIVVSGLAVLVQRKS